MCLQYTDRGIKIDSLVSSGPAYEGSDFYWNTAVSLTASQYINQDDGPGDRLVPHQILQYPRLSYNKPEQRVTTNIFQFSRAKEQFQGYDITPCFAQTEQLHLSIHMSWQMDMDLSEIKETLICIGSSYFFPSSETIYLLGKYQSIAQCFVGGRRCSGSRGRRSRW